ncbi:MAG: hypothetical protein JJU31_13540 [Wenzhouxiangella sp.]|nr:hypothetical protein [Wenzhouxiangella sp.]MCH8479679.1 hypothetical protein [Wenzhouxiangella sp.]TVR98912.1 MAG: hypothetical protein EA418_00665 [Wenzhouxiangellaceae bacterium]
MQDRRYWSYAAAVGSIAAGSAAAEIQTVGPFIVESFASSPINPENLSVNSGLDITGNGFPDFYVVGTYRTVEDSGYLALTMLPGSYVVAETFGVDYKVPMFAPGDVIDNERLLIPTWAAFFERDSFPNSDGYDGFFNQRGFFGVRLSGDTGNQLFACLELQAIARGGLTVEVRGGLLNTESGQPVTCPDFSDDVYSDSFEGED